MMEKLKKVLTCDHYLPDEAKKKLADNLRKHHKNAVTDLKNGATGNGKKKKLNPEKALKSLSRMKALQEQGAV